MNIKLKKAVSAAAVVTMTASLLPGFALTASAAPIETSYIGSSAAAETFDNYNPGEKGWTYDGTDDANNYFKTVDVEANLPFGNASGQELALQKRGSNPWTAKYSITSVTKGKVHFSADVVTRLSHLDGGSIKLRNSKGEDVLSVLVPNKDDGITVTGTTSEKARTFMGRSVVPNAFTVEADIDLDANTAAVTINQVRGKNDIVVNVVDTDIAELYLEQWSRSSTNNSFALDNVKFYSISEDGSGGQPSVPSGDIGEQVPIAATDANWSFGEFTYKDGNVGADAGRFAVSYAKKDAEGKAVKLFKNASGEKAVQLTIPFSKLPGDGRVISLYKDVAIPVNLQNGIVPKETSIITNVGRSNIKYLGTPTEAVDAETLKRTYVDIDSKTPFTTLTFSTNKDKKRCVAIGSADPVEIKDNKVIVPVTDDFADAESLLIYVAGTETIKVDNKDQAVTAGAFGTITTDYAKPQLVNVALSLTNTNGYLGKMNTDKLVSIAVDCKADDNGEIILYGTNSCGTTKFADADKIGSVKVNKGAKNAVITVKASAEKPYIYAVGKDAKKVSVTGAKANYTFDPGTDAAKALAELNAWYSIINTQISYQNASVNDLAAKKADIDNYVNKTLAGYKADLADYVEANCKAEASYIEQTKAGLEVREQCANAVNGLAPVAEVKYDDLRARRSDLEAAYKAYTGLLVAGMRCVDNIGTVKAYLDALAAFDNAEIEKYANAALRAKEVTGFTKTVDGKPVFDAALVNGGKDFESLASDIKTLNEYVDGFNSFDAAVQEGVAAKLGGADPFELRDEINTKVVSYKADTVEAFRTTYAAVEKAFTDAGKDAAKQAAALKIDGIDAVYALIQNDTDLINAINSGNGEYDKYAALHQKLLAYNVAQELLEKLAVLKEDIANNNGVTRDTYEQLATQLSEVKGLYDRYNTLTNNGAVNIDEETKAKVDAESAYINDAAAFLDNAAAELVKLAKEAIENSYNRDDQSETMAKNLLNAEYQYGLLKPKAKEYLAKQEFTGENGTTLTYDEAVKAARKVAEAWEEVNNKEIADIIAEKNDGFVAYVDGLNYTTVVKDIQKEVEVDKKKQMVHDYYTTDDLETWKTDYKTVVDKKDKINSYINGSVASYDANKDTYKYNRAATSQQVKDVDNAFKLEAKLATIFNFRSTIYLDAQADSAMTVVADKTQAVIDLLYPQGTLYSDIDTADLEAIKELVAAAYEAKKIDYKSSVGELAAVHKGTGLNITDAFKKEYDAYIRAYAAYMNEFGEAEPVYDGGTDAAQLAAGKVLYDEIKSYLAEVQATDEGIENDRLAKQAAADEEENTIIDIINELEKHATLTGYTTSSEVAADKAICQDVKARIDAAKADEDGKYTFAEENLFDLPTEYESKLVTIETAIEYWGTATELYENVKAGIEAADLRNEKYEEYTAARDAIYDAAEQQKVYFNQVAKNNSDEDIITNMEEKIAAYTAVNDNICDNIAKFNPETLTDYNNNVAYLDAAAAYIKTLSDNAAAEKPDAKLALQNEVYNGDDYADVREEVAAKLALKETIKPAAEFTKAVDEASGLAGDEAAQYEKIKQASSLCGSMVENSQDSLSYIGEPTMMAYNDMLMKYRTNLESEFVNAYNTLNKGSLSAPVTELDSKEWLDEVDAVKAAYSGMYKADQKTYADKKAVLDNIVEANKTYAADKVTAEALKAKIAKTISDYNTNKDAAAAMTAIDGINAEYTVLKDKYGDAEVQKIVDNYNELVSLANKIDSDSAAAKAYADFKAAEAKLDPKNITIDSYEDIQNAKKAWQAAVDADAFDDTQNYGKIGACEAAFNQLAEVTAEKTKADALTEGIAALTDPTVGTAEEQAAAKKAIEQAKADYDALTDYGKSLITEDSKKVLDDMVSKIKPEQKFDFNKDGEVGISDLNMAVLAKLGKNVMVVGADGKPSEITVKSIVDTDKDGKITLTELKAVIDAFSVNKK